MIKAFNNLSKLSEKNSKLETFKIVGGFIASIGTDIAMCCITGHFINLSKMGGFTKILAKFGAVLFGMKVGQDVDDFFCKTVDELKEMYDEYKLDIKNVMEVEGEVT